MSGDRIRIDDNIPIPTNARAGSSNNARTKETNAIYGLTTPGQSFFTACTGEERDLMQKRIQVRGSKMRQEGRINFFLITRQLTEDVEGVPTEGLRVWRREPEDDGESTSSQSSPDAATTKTEERSMKTTVDYSKSPAKAFDAVEDIREYLGKERAEKVWPEMGKIETQDQFRHLCGFAGIEGYPVQAWWEHYHGEGSWKS